MVLLGRFDFKDDSIASIIESFHAQLERVLQSEKNGSLKLDDNFQVKVKLIGISNMTHIRKNKERILNRLNIENHGDDNCNSIVGTIGIPNNFNFGEGAENTVVLKRKSKWHHLWSKLPISDLVFYNIKLPPCSGSLGSTLQLTGVLKRGTVWTSSSTGIGIMKGRSWTLVFY